MRQERNRQVQEKLITIRSVQLTILNAFLMAPFANGTSSMKTEIVDSGQEAESKSYVYFMAL
jgi:hypothetical protein